MLVGTRPNRWRLPLCVRAQRKALPQGPFRWLAWPVLVLLAAYLVFCHGCHGDEDNELLAAAQQKAHRGWPVGCKTRDND
jgi:hypothetical protein